MIPFILRVDFVCDDGELLSCQTTIGLPALPPEGTVIPLPRNPGHWFNWVGIVNQIELTPEYQFVLSIANSHGDEIAVERSAEEAEELLRKSGWTVIRWK